MMKLVSYVKSASNCQEVRFCFSSVGFSVSIPSFKCVNKDIDLRGNDPQFTLCSITCT